MRKVFCDVCECDTENVGGVIRMKRGIITGKLLGPMESYAVKFRDGMYPAPHANMEEVDVCPECHERIMRAIGEEVALIQAAKRVVKCPGCHLVTQREDGIAYCTNCEELKEKGLLGIPVAQHAKVLEERNRKKNKSVAIDKRKANA